MREREGEREDLRTDTDSEDWEIKLGRDNSKKNEVTSSTSQLAQIRPHC